MPKENKLKGQVLFKLTQLAEQDLREIWIYIAENNQNAADQLIEKIFEKFHLLARNKEIGRVEDDFLVGMRMFPFKNYHIYYFPTDDGVEIYRILHGRRDIEGLFEDFFEGLEE